MLAAWGHHTWGEADRLFGLPIGVSPTQVWRVWVHNFRWSLPCPSCFPLCAVKSVGGSSSAEGPEEVVGTTELRVTGIWVTVYLWFCLTVPFLIFLSHLDSAQGHRPLAHPTFMTLLLQDEKGAFNFDQDTVTNPETGEQVRSSMKPGCWEGGHRRGLTPGSWVLLLDSELVPKWRDMG